MRERRSRLGVRITLCLAGIVAGCGQDPVPVPSKPPPKKAILPGSLELEQLVRDPAVRILDVRPEEDFLRGHIPGAVGVNVKVWEAHSLLAKGLEDEAYWAEAVGSLGIDATTPVAVYGDHGPSMPEAARVWWLLEHLGVPHVFLLDGGWQAWQDSGYPVTTGPGQIAPRRFQPRRQAASLIGLEAVREGLKASALQVIDARERQEYTGETRLGTRVGHIPSAVNLPWTELLDAEGRFKPPGELRRIFREHEITGDKPLAVYCYTGARSSVVVLGLELAGFPGVKNYYRGWWEWSAATDTPVATQQ